MRLSLRSALAGEAVTRWPALLNEHEARHAGILNYGPAAWAFSAGTIEASARRGSRTHAERAGIVYPDPPATAAQAATAALEATSLLQTFGCVDLLQRSDGSWVVLEVGTDGLFTHLDRDLNDSAFETGLLERVCDSFSRRCHSFHATSR